MATPKDLERLYNRIQHDIDQKVLKAYLGIERSEDVTANKAHLDGLLRVYKLGQDSLVVED